MVKMRYQLKRPQDGSVAFVLKISMRKTPLVVVDQLRKKLLKLLRKLGKIDTWVAATSPSN